MSATTERATLPPVVCEPWCIYGDGHPGEWHADDQTCFTAYLNIPGTLLEPDPDSTDGEGENVNVFAEGWAAGHRPADVHISQSDRFGMRLTIDEAAQVARAILETVATVTGTGARTVLEEDLDLAVASVADEHGGLVHLEGDWPPKGEAWEFAPDEARVLAYALLAHAARAEAEESDR